MPNKQAKSSDDWLKILSILALSLSMKDDLSGYGKSVIIAAFAIIILAIMYKTIFMIFYCVVVVSLVYWAVKYRDQAIISFAILYFVLGIILFAEDERRRLGKGHFLSAIWWSGQFLIHLLGIHFSVERSEELDFFTLVFCFINAFMVIRKMVFGIRNYSKLKC